VTRLNKTAGAMPRIWEQLEARGFGLPRLFLDELCSLQVQDPALQPSSNYFVELIKERVGVFYDFWMISKRPSGKGGSYRSAYLDFLEARIKSGAWPELGKARQYANKTLDPAFMRYLELPFVEKGRHWLNLLDAYRAQVDAEAAISTRYSSLWKLSRDHSPARTRKIMAAVLKDVGFSPKQDRPDGGTAFSRPLCTPDVSIFCSLGDARQMKHGIWSLGIGFCSSNDDLNKLTYDSVLVLEGLSFWLPGGEWYLRHEGSPSRIVLGITVCATLADLLSQAFDSS
jgi:hypothetical protein